MNAGVSKEPCAVETRLARAFVDVSRAILLNKNSLPIGFVFNCSSRLCAFLARNPSRGLLLRDKFFLRLLTLL